MDFIMIVVGIIITVIAAIIEFFNNTPNITDAVAVGIVKAPRINLIKYHLN